MRIFFCSEEDGSRYEVDIDELVKFSGLDAEAIVEILSMGPLRIDQESAKGYLILENSDSLDGDAENGDG